MSEGLGYSASGGVVGETCFAHLVGVPAVPVGPPHCVRFQEVMGGPWVVIWSAERMVVCKMSATIVLMKFVSVGCSTHESKTRFTSG